MSKIGRVKNPEKNILLFVEGDTEENYFKEFKKNNPNLKIKFKNIKNMNGGGYSNFLKLIRKESTIGYIAFFIVIDLDKVYTNYQDFKKLLDYCTRKNKENTIPFFLIGTNKDFELFACCHCNKFKIGKNTKSYIEKDFKFKDLDKFKSNEKIYNFLNKDGRSYMNALNNLSKRTPYIENIYVKSQKGIDIKIKINKTNVNQYALTSENSNISELFDILST